MTSVDFKVVRQMMLILKQLRSEVDRGDYSRRELCIQMHDDVCKQLYPFFEELAAMDMLVLFTKPEGDKPADVSNLEVDGINGGIQLSKKEDNEEEKEPEEDNEGDNEEEGEGFTLTAVTDPNDPAFDPNPEMRTFAFDFPL
jgi:hypothetical protein